MWPRSGSALSGSAALLFDLGCASRNKEWKATSKSPPVASHQRSVKTGTLGPAIIESTALSCLASPVVALVKL